MLIFQRLETDGLLYARFCLTLKIDNVLQRYNLLRSRDNCCHGNATICSLFIVVGTNVVVVIKVFSVSMEMQQWVPFALLSNYKIFRTAAHNNKH
jgi:hypothetical protein